MSLSLNPLFSGGTLLQCGKPVRISGMASPGTAVTVQIQGRESSATADANGVWEAVLPALQPSAQETLAVRCGAEHITVEDAAVGEVWVAGGQSNMEFEMAFEAQRTGGRRFAPCAEIRFFDIPELSMPGQEAVFDYSNVGKWRKVTEADIDWFSAVGYYFAESLHAALGVPVGIIGCSMGGTRAAAWMRRETVEALAPEWIADCNARLGGKDPGEFTAEQLSLPTNGQGNRIHDAFYQFMLPRTPSMEEILQFFAPMMDAAEASTTTDSEGNKSYPVPMTPQELPGSLYEHMVKRAAKASVRGVLWYQGEAEDDRPFGPALYGKLLPALIADWRALWGEELPFLPVQLPGYESWLGGRANNYPEIRRRQQMVADTVPGVWLVSAGDCGEQTDIHPKHKAVIGQRLALAAEGHVYGRPVLCDGPVLSAVGRDGESIILRFGNTGDGLRVAGDTVNALRLEGTDGEIPFSFSVEGDCLRLTPERRAVCCRIAYAQENWYMLNLMNSAGIPAFPFAEEL